MTLKISSYLFAPEHVPMKILPDSNCMMKLQPPEHPKILQERFRDVICGVREFEPSAEVKIRLI